MTQSLRSLAYYHHDVYVFHTHFLDDSDHTYESQPIGWLLLNRGVGVNADTDIQPGRQGCDAPEGSDCLRQVLLLGTPALWWGSLLALIASVVLWAGQRDWRFGVPVVGTAVDLAAVAGQRRPADLPLLRRDDRAVPGDRLDPGDGQAGRPLHRADPATEPSAWSSPARSSCWCC